MDMVRNMLSGVLSAKGYIHWVEFFVILAIAVYFGYLAYSLKLFKKG